MGRQKYFNLQIAALILLLGVALILPVNARGATSSGITYSIKQNVITLKWGEKPSGGYAIAINSVKREGEKLTVYYSLRKPVPGEMVTQAVTYPQASAVIPAGKERISQVKLIEQAWPASKTALPTVGSIDNLKKLLEEAGVNGGGYVVNDMAMKSAAPAAAGAVRTEASTAASDNAGRNYSSTNTQVAGVDEADLVKTDGEYIYQIKDNQIRIVRAYPAKNMTAAATIRFEAGFNPAQMYVDSKYLVVIGSTARNYPLVKDQGISQKMVMPIWRYNELTRMVVYDISNRQSPKQVREIEISGNLVDSRKIGTAVYLVTNQYIYGRPGDPDFPMPFYRDGVNGSQEKQLDVKDIKYFPGCVSANYLNVAGINIAGQTPVNVESYLGAGNEVYVSPTNLYVTARYYPVSVRPLAMEMSSVADSDLTRVFKFGLNQGKITYSGQGEVPGRVLNQFSMDEYSGFFRVATTIESYRSNQWQSSNSIYVLDSNLKTVGKIENIAPGEQIYSARFLGERVYMVTFRTVDPFYVIDLKVPTSPKILGALKIPGYSDYLHPYDANHVIGFGKDTVEMSNKYEPGQTNAYYLGMKMALFDVTDVKNPKQKFVEYIGDRGTDSELLHNHKALLFSREKNLIAFPVSLHEVKTGAGVQDTSFPAYGAFTWQGAYVYGLDLKQGFKLQAKISHLTSEDYLKSGYYGAEYQKMVQRILYIQDTLYTLSPSMIQAHDLKNFKPLASFQY